MFILTLAVWVGINILACGDNKYWNFLFFSIGKTFVEQAMVKDIHQEKPHEYLLWCYIYTTPTLPRVIYRC